MKSITDLLHSAVTQLEKDLDARNVDARNVVSVKLKPFVHKGEMKVAAKAHISFHLHSEAGEHDEVRQSDEPFNGIPVFAEHARNGHAATL